MAFPFGFVTGAAEELTAQRKAQQEADRKLKELAYQSQLQKELKMTPDALPPSQADYYGAQAEEARAKAKTAGVPTMWDVQKEARTTVNAMINQNPSLQLQAFKNPTLVTNMINQEVERLSGRYRQSQSQQDFQTKSQRLFELTDPATGTPKKGSEGEWKQINSELLGKFGGAFKEGGPLAEGGPGTQNLSPEQTTSIGAIREYANNPTPENLKKVMAATSNVSSTKEESSVMDTNW